MPACNAGPRSCSPFHLPAPWANYQLSAAAPSHTGSLLPGRLSMPDYTKELACWFALRPAGQRHPPKRRRRPPSRPWERSERRRHSSHHHRVSRLEGNILFAVLAFHYFFVTEMQGIFLVTCAQDVDAFVVGKLGQTARPGDQLQDIGGRHHRIGAWLPNLACDVHH